MLEKKDIVKVSVLMTAYNRERFIGEAIESVLASTYSDFELVVVDDASSDHTVEIARKYAEADQRVKVLVNERNLGDYPNRNNAARFATGKYIKYVDSDDKLYPEGLQYCVDCMERSPEADWSIIYPKAVNQEFILNSREALQLHFFTEPFLKAGPGQAIMKRSFFEGLGGYPEKYGPANDMYFNLKAAAQGNTLVIKDNFLFYRRHDEQEQSDQYKYLYNYNKYLKDALAELSLPLSDKEIHWLQLKRKRRFAVNIMRYFLSTGNILKTIDAIKRADYSVKDFLQGLFHNVPKPNNHLPSSIEL